MMIDRQKHGMRLGRAAMIAVAVLLAVALGGVRAGASAGDSPGFTAQAAATLAPVRLSVSGTPVTLTIDVTGTRPESSTNPTPNPEYPMNYVDVGLDRHITVGASGLPICTAANLKFVTPPVARKRCGRALVGSGTEEVTALQSAGEAGTFSDTFDLLFFNTTEHGRPAILMYRSYTRIPQGIAWPIGGAGNLHVKDVGGEDNRTLTDSIHIRIGKTWRYKGARHSYLTGRCPTGTLRNSIKLELSSGSSSETTSQRCTEDGHRRASR